MKILRIGGKNLASLAGEFRVDFEQEPLASSGLFAISGPTGAGKSTLLDALCLALYDATPRLLKVTRGASVLPDVGDDTVSALDPRTLLRRGAAEAWAEVDFVGNDNLRYRARWSVRRSRGKAGGALQKSDMTLHQLPDMAALGRTKTEVAAEIVQRIGLSFEQFTRAVLLAQNEFSAFLKTDENERGELLETLTGSTVYTEISKRAFERYKAEQQAMRLLSARLADQAPLAPEERAAVDVERAAADAALAALDARRTVLERQVRWHDDLARLRGNETLAEEALAGANAQVAAAAERRRRLATLDAVQAARPLTSELARIEGELAQAQAALAAGEQELARALDAQQQAAQALAVAADQVAAAEGAQRAAAPDLDQAKALDATLAALAPAHAQALAARDAARGEAEQARAAQQEKARQLATTRAAQQAAAGWLGAHGQQEALAAQWPRWDRLLQQAEAAAALDAGAAAALATAEDALQQAAALEAQAAGAVSAAAQSLRQREAARQEAAAALAGFDADALRAARQAHELRRERLAAAEKTWTALAGARSRQQEADEQAAQAQRAHDSARQALDAATAGAGALSATAEQAERSLKAAELACAGNVEDLRATLLDDEPCPVCGSAEHPYRHQGDARLHAMLEGLVAEVTRCRRRVEANLAAQATQQAALTAATERLEALARERGALATTLADLATIWAADAVAQEAPAEADRTAWFAAQLDAVRQAVRAVDTQEQAVRQAALARDAAQQACDKASAEHVRLNELALAARAALARAQTELGALAAKREAAATNLAAPLAELDPVLAPACGDGWQRAWRDAAAAYRAARAAEAREWAEQSAAHARHGAALGTLDAEQAAAAARLEQAERIAAAAQAEFARVDADILGQRRARSALWDGKPVREVEQALAAMVAQARAALGERQAAAVQAAQAETRVRTALAQGHERIAALQAAGSAASGRLAEWLEEFAGSHAQLEPVANQAELAVLLAVGAGWLAQERAALDQLAGAAGSAATVLAERRAQRELHQQAVVQDEALAAEEAVAALEALLAERSAVEQAAGALRLRAAQDDARRQQAQAVLAEIERQQAIEQRWGRLSELIGSADGKKFRNYAQQFTLDVLLGYANSHLAQLARRYRLERVVHKGAPSLALMVRDQDMGGEVRSVNSLSGGESFLVSLALALGLASLSSNRVRVESLFIDEGFGSLDSETLGVAMDALDALQSLGRKVGVISHVQEMTERIAAKIIVRPAGGGSSAVTVQ